LKSKHVVNKCSQQGPRRCSARIASKAKSHVKMVEIGHDVGSECSKDTCGESLPCLKSDGKQTSSYVPSLEGDDNSDELQDDVEIPHGSSANKPKAPKGPLSTATSPPVANVNNLPSSKCQNQ